MTAPSTFAGNLTASPVWEEELRIVRGFRDKLGMRVDADIEATVVALRLLGFKTTMSCAGHHDRRTTGPYVMFESQTAKEFIRKADALRQGDKHNSIRVAQSLAQREADSLRSLIETFNHERAVSGLRPLLELRPVGPSGLRLCFVHADFDEIRDEKSYNALLEARQVEMHRFTKTMVEVLESQFRSKVA